MSQPLRIAFMGTPDFVKPTVEALINSHHNLVCVYTQPPRAQGRHQNLEKTPVHVLAKSQNIEVRHPINFKSEEDIKAFQNLNLDVAVVAAFGMLLPQAILDAPKYGCINIHPSLLPRWRGPSPIQYAIWKGDKVTGVSVMSLEKSMDTGPIIAQEQCLITDKTTFESLNEALWQKGTALLNQVLEDISQTGLLKNNAQDSDKATYCKLLTKADGKIDFNQTAQEISQQIRGLNPWPGTWCLDYNEKRLKVLEGEISEDKTTKKTGTILEQGKIACAKGTILSLEKIQPENKKPMGIQDALNGGYLNIGDILS